MGKSLKGKECGKGIYQRKDGLYSARFVDAFGKRHEKYFQTIPEARNWIEEAKYAVKHDGVFVSNDMTVDKWFDFWTNNIIGDLSNNTIRNYRERYVHNIQPVLGKMLLNDVKPMHCKEVLVRMEPVYAGSTIRQTFIAMGSMFKSAKTNDLIAKHPMDGVQFTKPVRATDDIKFLTREEQNAFLEVARNSHNYYQYALILETGLRTGEMVGLTWNCIDFEKRTLTVNKTMEYRYSTKCWCAGPPKTPQSYRTIPLTDKAYGILKELWDNRKNRKESPTLDIFLEYMDLHTGNMQQFCMRDLVFINWRTGDPNKSSSYDTHLYKLCDKAKIRRFCMHALRHTYATRAIEYGVQPKVLQKLLGHTNLKTTMDTYVHVTDDFLEQGVILFQNGSLGQNLI